MTSDAKLDPIATKVASRLGISAATGELSQSASEATRLGAINPFTLLATFPKATSEALAFLESIGEQHTLDYIRFFKKDIRNFKNGKQSLFSFVV